MRFADRRAWLIDVNDNYYYEVYLVQKVTPCMVSVFSDTLCCTKEKLSIEGAASLEKCKAQKAAKKYRIRRHAQGGEEYFNRGKGTACSCVSLRYAIAF